jgi:hypothetical protein
MTNQSELLDDSANQCSKETKSSDNRQCQELTSAQLRELTGLHRLSNAELENYLTSEKKEIAMTSVLDLIRMLSFNYDQAQKNLSEKEQVISQLRSVIAQQEHRIARLEENLTRMKLQHTNPITKPVSSSMTYLTPESNSILGSTRRRLPISDTVRKTELLSRDDADDGDVELEDDAGDETDRTTLDSSAESPMVPVGEVALASDVESTPFDAPRPRVRVRASLRRRSSQRKPLFHREQNGTLAVPSYDSDADGDEVKWYSCGELDSSDDEAIQPTATPMGQSMSMGDIPRRPASMSGLERNYLTRRASASVLLNKSTTVKDTKDEAVQESVQESVLSKDANTTTSSFISTSISPRIRSSLERWAASWLTWRPLGYSSSASTTAAVATTTETTKMSDNDDDSEDDDDESTSDEVVAPAPELTRHTTPKIIETLEKNASSMVTDTATNGVPTLRKRYSQEPLLRTLRESDEEHCSSSPQTSVTTTEARAVIALPVQSRSSSPQLASVAQQVASTGRLNRLRASKVQRRVRIVMR